MTTTAKNSVRLIAFYLPQFHTIAENDEWWGKGFTEWTNVTRAKSLFPGHRQPRVPADLGYYDLSASDVLEQQANYAREHGLEGFCYYYYYFGKDRQLLEMPVERLLKTGRPDFPFCLCWANENWTRAWDGGHNKVLMRQEYGPEDIEGFARSVIPYFQDPRYIRVNGKPLLVIYHTRSIPNTPATITRLRQIWREEAGLEVHLAAALTFAEGAPLELGVDCAVEFPPHNVRNADVPRESIPFHQEFQGTVWDYHTHVLDTIAAPDKDFPCFPTVVTDWDNTARRGNRGSLFVNSNPVAYQQWLLSSIQRTSRCHPEGSRLVFINAWNEWAEGTYLEPDTQLGLAYLQATKYALQGQDYSGVILQKMNLGEPLAETEARVLQEALGNYSSVFSASKSAAESWFHIWKARSDKLPDAIHRLQIKLAESKEKTTRERSKNDKLRKKAELEQSFREGLEATFSFKAFKPLIKLEKRLRRQRGINGGTALKSDLPAPKKIADSGNMDSLPASTLPTASQPLVQPAVPLHWTSDTTIQWKNTSVRLAVDQDLRLLESTPEQFILGKSRNMMEQLIAWLTELQPRHIVDIGVFKGGSAVFLNEFCRPEMLVAIERNPAVCEPLQTYLTAHNFSDSVKIHYGIDQASLPDLEGIYEDDFGTNPLDLVIDDASHFLFETRESFRFFFPHLRPGGYYIIEDWGWAHWAGDHWQKEKGGEYFQKKDPLSNLILELMLLSASAPDLVESVWTNCDQVLVKRGPRQLKSPFRPEEFILNRGREIPTVPAP